MTDLVFSVQDDTGTVYQLETVASPNAVVNVGDVGLYTGIPDNGTDAKVIPAEISQPFTVTQVLDATHFSITSRPDTLTTGWPRSGVIDWVTGGNISIPTTIVRIEAANAYTTIDEVKRYLASRGRDLGAFTDVQTQAAIVDASDYIDQRYVFKGVKRTQKFGTNVGPQNGVFVEPWLSPRAWGVVGSNILVPSTTPQETQWPRQGAVDRNGDTINGLPTAVKHACAELVYRVAKGTVLQPDYDPTIVTPGGVLASKTEKVGPIERQFSYDTKLGLGFFPTIPQVTRMLSKAGLLSPSGGGSIIR